MKKNKYIAILILLSTFVVACGDKSLKSEETLNNSNTHTSSIDARQKKDMEILENSYLIENYRFKLMPMQKKDEQVSSTILSDFDVTIESNFEKLINEIDSQKKINILTSFNVYDDKNEKLNVNYFLVNNSTTVINYIELEGNTEFKNIPKQAFKFEFSNEQFGSLKENEFIHFSASYDIPITYMNELKTMKRKDLKIDIKTIKVNGVEIDNNETNLNYLD